MARKAQNDSHSPKSEQEVPPVKAPNRSYWLKIALVVLVVLGLLASFSLSAYFYFQYQAAVADPQATAERSTRNLIEQLGKLIELPAEEPTIATVSDVTKLQSQPFFANAQNGDKVFIFTTSKKAILYRSNSHKIIEVATISLDENLIAE
jgi:flagellar basal body-associated protein FliL